MSTAPQTKPVSSHPAGREMTLRELSHARLHHGKGRFINPFNPQMRWNPLEFAKWKLFSGNRYRPLYIKEHVRTVNIDWQKVALHNGLSITFIKHACVMIKDRGTTILIDPIFSGLIGPFKDYTPLGFSAADMPAPGAILITHGHYDHLDLPTLQGFSEASQIITPLGYQDILPKQTRHAELDWYDTISHGTCEIICLPCNHWSMRDPLQGPNRSLWSSYLVKTSAGKNIYISGDTAYFAGFDDIGRDFEIDLAVFNLGAYEPRWFMKKSHMNPPEVVRAFGELKAKHLMIVHWGTFRLGDEPVYMPPFDIRQAMDAASLGRSLIHLDHGQTLFYA